MFMKAPPRRRRRGGARRRTTWVRHTQAPTVLTAGTPVSSEITSTFSTSYGADLLGFTLLRSVCVFEASGAGAAVTDFTRVRTGMIMAPALVESVDISPVSLPDLDWFYYDVRQFRGTPAANGPEGMSFSRWVVDLRSKRAFKDIGNAVFLCMEAEGNNSTFSAQINQLWALP